MKFIHHTNSLIIQHEIFKDRFIPTRKYSVKKIKEELCVSSILTDICIDAIYGRLNISSFTIDTDKYINLLFQMNDTHKNKYRFLLNILQNTLSEYIQPVIKGYYYREIGISEPTYFTINKKLDTLIDRIFDNKSPYYVFDLNTLSYQYNPIVEYHYNNNVYTSYADILKSKKIKFGEYQTVLADIKSKTNVVYIECSGIDKQKIDFDKQYINNDNNAVLYHSSKLSLTALYKIKEYELQYGTNNKTPLHIINNILQNINSDGTYTQYYHSGLHGRLYMHGYNLQLLNEKYREYVLNEYYDVDIRAATYSILWNYAKEYGIHEDDMPTITEYVTNVDLFRQTILKDLQIYDKNVTLKYVKDILNAYAFGARMTESLVMYDINHNTKYSIPVVTNGYSLKETPLNIVTNKKVQALALELKSIAKKLIYKHTDKSGVITNCLGLKLQRGQHRLKYGVKLAHIYQGAEVRVLKTLMNYQFNGTPLIKIPNAIGLLLHDGLYIQKQIYNAICSTEPFEIFLEKKLGYTLKFS